MLARAGLNPLLDARILFKTFMSVVPKKRPTILKRNLAKKFRRYLKEKC